MAQCEGARAPARKRFVLQQVRDHAFERADVCKYDGNEGERPTADDGKDVIAAARAPCRRDGDDEDGHDEYDKRNDGNDQPAVRTFDRFALCVFAFEQVGDLFKAEVAGRHGRGDEENGTDKHDRQYKRARRVVCPDDVRLEKGRNARRDRLIHEHAQPQARREGKQEGEEHFTDEDRDDVAALHAQRQVHAEFFFSAAQQKGAAVAEYPCRNDGEHQGEKGADERRFEFE